MSETELVSYSPATGEEVWRGPHDDVEQAVSRSRRAWPQWAATSQGQRIELARRFANEVRTDAEDIAVQIAKETGKPLWEARTEVDAVIGKIEISIQAYAERTGRKKRDGALQGVTAVRHKPHGVMVVLGPYNFPAHLPNGHMVPALIAGNTVILKPSEKAPGVAMALLECWKRCGIPENVVQVVIGGPEEGSALVAHAGIDGVLFTGSAQTGIAINRKLASNPGKIVALEMGGNNPIVVTDTPLVTDACALIIQSAFTSAGQRCTAARRLIVVDNMYEPLMEQLIPLARKIQVDEPFADPQPFMGPVIDNEAAEGITESFVALMTAGGKPLLPMRRLRPQEPFVTPGIIDTTDIPDRPDIELFGPLLQVIRVPDLDAGIAEANNTRFGLSASLIGGSPDDYSRFWANTRAGLINWNRPTNGASSSSPFGGIGLSGNHRPAAYYAADYCAYPVSSNEMDQPRANIAIGLKDEG
ncbi:succinylglutamate-semialdehyde dehydrogenase [Erythrobacter sp. SCSIO 43205]|uniref:succinylglutamate-semialdehyde dehydrogenase n=1 Tax=Erythrobacter sp. SCSIO 43205 TaxID=2779361 RepID=UPI001CA9A30B|nr:succinylglutamate-semialdehyde dehydrogenase [Erythrobacter sp. SCSIO 43205]UAB79523.1 succinylglutamate-semialdehyde dehydrogenase [Erythrobacter sp. SCSIO 43205]